LASDSVLPFAKKKSAMGVCASVTDNDVAVKH
jgi:hypothetical protein